MYHVFKWTSLTPLLSTVPIIQFACLTTMRVHCWYCYTSKSSKQSLTSAHKRSTTNAKIRSIFPTLSSSTKAGVEGAVASPQRDGVPAVQTQNQIHSHIHISPTSPVAPEIWDSVLKPRAELCIDPGQSGSVQLHRGTLSADGSSKAHVHVCQQRSASPGLRPEPLPSLA